MTGTDFLVDGGVSAGTRWPAENQTSAIAAAVEEAMESVQKKLQKNGGGGVC